LFGAQAHVVEVSAYLLYAVASCAGRAFGIAASLVPSAIFLRLSFGLSVLLASGFALLVIQHRPVKSVVRGVALAEEEVAEQTARRTERPNDNLKKIALGTRLAAIPNALPAQLATA
jgi:hypothetical protein